MVTAKPTDAESEIEEIAKILVDAIGIQSATPKRVKLAEFHLREIQRRATKRERDACIKIALKHAGQWEPQNKETADLEDEAHISAAFDIARVIKERN